MSGLVSGKVLVGFSLDLKFSEGNNHSTHKYFSPISFLYHEHELEKSEAWKCNVEWNVGMSVRWGESHTGLNPEQRKQTVVISCLISVKKWFLDTHAHPHRNSASVLDPAHFHTRGPPRAGEKSSLGHVHTEASLKNTRSRGIAILNQPIGPSSLVSLPPAVAKPWSFRGRQPAKSAEHLAWEKYSS